jgi:hypothetical protein
MTYPLPLLEPHELDLVRGGGGSLDLSLTASPGRAQMDLTHAGPHSSLTGSYSRDPGGWSAGVRLSAQPSPKVGLDGFYRTNGRDWEAGVSARVRFLRT